MLPNKETDSYNYSHSPVEFILMFITLEFVPGTNQYWSVRVQFIAQGINMSVWWVLNSRLIELETKCQMQSWFQFAMWNIRAMPDSLYLYAPRYIMSSHIWQNKIRRISGQFRHNCEKLDETWRRTQHYIGVTDMLAAVYGQCSVF